MVEAKKEKITKGKGESDLEERKCLGCPLVCVRDLIDRSFPLSLRLLDA